MKKIISAFAILLALTVSASAHHMAANDDAGTSIPEDSPHLDMVF